MVIYVVDIYSLFDSTEHKVFFLRAMHRAFVNKIKIIIIIIIMTMETYMYGKKE